MTTSTQKAHTEIFGFIAVLVFKCSSHQVLFTNRNYPFRTILKHVRDQLSVLFQFAWLYL